MLATLITILAGVLMGAASGWLARLSTDSELIALAVGSVVGTVVGLLRGGVTLARDFFDARLKKREWDEGERRVSLATPDEIRHYARTEEHLKPKTFITDERQ